MAHRKWWKNWTELPVELGGLIAENDPVIVQFVQHSSFLELAVCSRTSAPHPVPKKDAALCYSRVEFVATVRAADWLWLKSVTIFVKHFVRRIAQNFL